jgi:hypothetical protein
VTDFAVGEEPMDLAVRNAKSMKLYSILVSGTGGAERVIEESS